MNKLSTEKRVQITGCFFVKGHSIRAANEKVTYPDAWDEGDDA